MQRHHVSRLEYRQQVSLRSEHTHTDGRSASLGSRYYHAWCSRSWLSARLSEVTQRTCRIHGHPLAGPECLVESKHLETHSKRLFVARLEGQSAWARNQMHARNGRSSPLLSLYRYLGITLHSTRLDYVLGGIRIESNKSKCCPALPMRSPCPSDNMCP